MFILEKVALFFRERRKYLLAAYMGGYLISLMQTGIPNWQYLIPLKSLAIMFGWGWGNAFYKQDHKVKKYEGEIRINTYWYNGVKYGLSALLLTGLYSLMLIIFGVIFHFDETPFR